MKIYKKLQFGITTLLLVISISSVSIAHAQGTVAEDKEIKSEDLFYKFTTTDDPAVVNQPVTTDYISSLPEGTPGQIIGQTIYLALIVANILAFFSLVVAGVLMLMSQGSEDEITKSKKIFQYSIMAMFVAATALAVVTGITRIQFFN